MIDADSRSDAGSGAIEPGREDWLRRVRNKKQRERYGPRHLSAVRGFGLSVNAQANFLWNAENWWLAE